MALSRIKLCLVFIISVISRVSALSCMPCNPSLCQPNLAIGCTAGITKDVCGCCNVCAKAEGETCGGPWDISGTCGNGLKCVKPNIPHMNDFNADGTCVLENPVNLPFIFHGFNMTGFGGLGLSGFSGSSFTMNNGIPNFNGITLGGGDICIKACILNYLPVCGSDQKTYPNQCSLENAQCTNQGLTFQQKGVCGSQPPVTPIYCYKAMCTRDYRPVCGNDGQTYSNDCELNNAKCDKKALSKVHNGPCVKTILPSCKKRHCPLTYEPICGSDGETYGNQCIFENAMCDTVTLVSVQPGPCASACNVCYGTSLHNNGFDLDGFAGITLSGFGGHTFSLFNGINLYNGLNLAGSSCYTICTAIYLPVCGSDQKTYPNECSLENAKCDNPFLRKSYTGKCGEVQYPEGTTCIKAICSDHGFPICGSDGITYTCLCAFNNAKCDNSFLQITSYGTCVEIEIPVICKTPYCTLEYMPVCGSDGKTYGNDCIFKNAKCDDVFLTKVGDGACDDCKNDICTLEYFPICGSDGNTYGNECFFHNAKCDNPLLTKKHNGGCEEPTLVCSRRFCFEIYKPVCGSDGKTYSNECYLSNAKCENNFLSIAYEGVCEILWRFDFRCGRKYTLASGRPAQCNPNSPTAFCCSASGWCGHSDFHCNCRDCTNYKKFSLDNLLLSSVTRLQTTCGHTNDCQSTLQSLQQFVSLQKQHIELLNHNGDLMKGRLQQLEQQTTGSLGKLHYLVALHYGCQHPFRFLEGTEECFYFHSEKMTYTEAKRACIMQSAEIAKPDNFQLFTQFTSRTSTSSSFSVTSTMGSDIFDLLEMQPFIGAQLGANGKFTWEDNSEVDLDNWQKKLKDPSKPSCGVYCPSCAYTNVPIDLSDCNMKRPFICKKRKGVTNGITNGITSGINGGIPNVGPNTVITNTNTNTNTGGDLNSQLLANLLASIQQNG